MSDYLELLDTQSQYLIKRSKGCFDEANFIESIGYKMTDECLKLEVLAAYYMSGRAEGLKDAATMYKELKPYDN